MTQYPWAANVFKLQRAIAAAGPDESAIKAEYVKMGGLLIGDPEPTVAAVHTVEEVTVSEPAFAEKVDESPQEEAPVEEKPKKAAKKVKK